MFRCSGPNLIILLSLAFSYNMSVTYDVYRGSPEGKIVADKVTHTLGQNEVYIETTASGLCGTDEHYLKTNQVLGHEGVGIVKALGPGVGSVKVGDRVGFGYTHSICAACNNCATGKCPTFRDWSTVLTAFRLGSVLP